VQRSLAAAVLVALAVLAGCGGVASDDAERTLTPAPVPTAQQFPPGVTADGVSASALVAAHRNRLLTTNFTATVERRVVDANGTVARSRRRHRVAAGGEPYFGRYNRTFVRFGIRRPVDSVAYWSGAGGFALRFGSDGSSTLDWSRDRNRSLDVDGSRQLRQLLGVFSTTTVEPRADGAVLIATGASDLSALPGPTYVGDRQNASARIEVDRDGLVTGWRVAYDARFDDRPVRVVTTVRVSGVGTTTVPRPDWVKAASELPSQ
jgi:multidrug efflux pump subunit AcrA (membrane-fusion protein)